MKREKLKFRTILAYALGISTGAQFIGSVIATYVLVFMTDTFGVAPAAVGVITFIATIWDAINDPMMGVLADKTKSSWGRYRPYLLFIPIPLAVVSTLLFAAPELSPGGKIAYCAVLYICYGMLTTAMQIPYGALIPSMTKDPKESTKIVQAYTFIAALVILVATSFTTVFVEKLGKGDVSKGYMILIGIGGLFMVGTSLFAFFNCKEKYVNHETSLPFKVAIKKLLKRKEILPVMVVWCVGFLGFQIMMASSVYYMLYVIKNPVMIPIYMLSLNIGGMIGIIFIIPLFMKLFKGSARKAFMASQFLTVIIYTIAYIVGHSNFTFILVISCIGAVFATMANAYIPLICVEMTDYIEYKTGDQMNGVMASIRGFSNKCGIALSNGITGIVLGATGYVAGDIFGQSASAIAGISACRWLVPIIAGIIVIICLLPYPVDKVKGEIMKFNEARHKTDGDVVNG